MQANINKSAEGAWYHHINHLLGYHILLKIFFQTNGNSYQQEGS